MSKLRHTILSTLVLLFVAVGGKAQINTDQVMRIGQNNLYFEDYVLSIQYFNQVINVKPHLAKPYFLRSVAKLNLDDYLGAEADATLALERNPFITDAYEVRGVARQNMGKLAGAIEDYDRALEMLPENRGLLYNKAIAQHDAKDLAGADATFATLLKRFPNFDSGYLGRARLRLDQKDTVAALADIDRALEINKNAYNAYVLRADIAIGSRKDYAAALADMDAAIKLQPHWVGFFINRAYLRYMNDDFQGSFADYDYAIQLEPDNTTALFNRGLLRAEVHDTNRAIDDFTTVLRLKHNDYKTLYNRAILLADIGHYREAIADLDRVIEAFPDFAAAYFLRYDVKRRKGDRAGSEKDYKKSLALAKTRVQTGKDIFSGGKNSSGAVEGDADESTVTHTQEEVKERFTSLTTIADNSAADEVFNSKEIRGKVQDRNITIELEPIFQVTYYTSPTELKLGGDYLREVNDLNATSALHFVLQVTNHEPPMTDERVAQRHFNSIAEYDKLIAAGSQRAVDYFGRAMDHLTLHNYDGAIADLDRAVQLSPTFTLAYLLRANARFLKSKMEARVGASDGGAMRSPALRLALADLDEVVKLSPEMPIAFYNRGVMLAESGDYTSALQAFTRAIELRSDFGEGYYNRGYVYLTLGNRDAAFADLSKAGQLGIVPSYNLLKRMSR